MVFDPRLAVAETLTNDRLQEVFQCGGQGGMRRSHATNTLVLTTGVAKASPYKDRWMNDVLHYTGMGQSGSQRLEYSQNRTLSESRDNGVAVFLFEVTGPNQYVYQGQVELAGEPYPDIQDGADSLPRQVWVFPLRLVGGQRPAPIGESEWERRQRKAADDLRNLSDRALLFLADRAPRIPGTRSVVSTIFDSSQAVVLYAKRRANGRCELCLDLAPFVAPSGDPFLVTHHIESLAAGGEDATDNIVALCPNCHAKVHFLNSPDDVAKLKGERAKAQPPEHLDRLEQDSAVSSGPENGPVPNG